MTNSPQVVVARRFTRSIRVDTDIGDPAALKGYVLTRSAVDALELMARHRQSTGHSAFIWTGPYGSGKSSLAVTLATMLSGNEAAIAMVAGDSKIDLQAVYRAFRPDAMPWKVVAVVGQRTSPENAISDALRAAGIGGARKAGERLTDWILRTVSMAKNAPVALIVDELGKFLEHAAVDGGDLHILQELAEISARTDKFLLVGILHQAFDEYAHRLTQQSRDEWQKIQGRFLDLSISLAGEEQIELISQAISVSGRKAATDDVTDAVASAIRGGRADGQAILSGRLASCWPLHPLTAALLGPLSRRRFGQSQRSIFGFLTSAEPFGFQEFIQDRRFSEELYTPAQLWNYLRANLEPAILASPDGHRWSTALDSIDRCETKGAEQAHFDVLKTIALIDLFKDRSGLQATPEIIGYLFGTMGEDDIARVTEDLLRWSVIVYRKHSDTYAIYAGSDFNIEQAIENALSLGVSIDFKQLAAQAALQPILAKRHYELTGALRWFEVAIAPLHEVEEHVQRYRPAPGSAGLFLILVSAQGETKAVANRLLAKAAAAASHLVILGWTRDSYRLRELGTELAALEYVRVHRPELEGDAVARREVDARISRIAADLDDRLSEAMELVSWKGPDGTELDKIGSTGGPAALNILASRLADWLYPKTPLLRNELVNRTKPSSNAAAATRALLRAMVEQNGHARLGIVGFPPEAGLFVSLLDITGLYGQHDDGQCGFLEPRPNDAWRLHDIWVAADEAIVKSNDGCSIDAIYNIWKTAPFGTRDGLLSILSLAYLLTRSDRIAIYLDGVFRPQLDSFLVDRLLQEPSAVSVKFVELTQLDSRFVAGLARRLSGDIAIEPQPLEVAKALVQIVRALPQWTTRTSLLSDDAICIRNLLRTASDPNKLLFEDLPGQLSSDNEGDALAAVVFEAMVELQDAYSAMLSEMAIMMMSELRYLPSANDDYQVLHRRAELIRGLSGNFRLDALATRLIGFEGNLVEIESIASLAANKPPRDWVDRDIDAAKIELAALAQQFLRAEGLAHLKGREDGRTTLTVYMSDPSFPEPAAPHFELDAEERREASEVAARVGALLSDLGVKPHIAMGALAQLGLLLADDSFVDEVRFMEMRS
jgi:hypothetical protein